jgi:uncharacterized membrane protein (UPF0136 family)
LTGTGLLYIIYALVLLAGGAMGYSRARSIPSLVAGTVSAIVMLTAAFVLDHHPRIGAGLGILVSVVLGIVFIRRYQATKKAMPAVPVIAFSGLVLVISILKIAGMLPAHRW